MTILLSAIVIGLIVFLLYAILHIHKLQQQVSLLDKEQHTQNKEIIQLMQANIQHGEMLLQHIEILKYLIEQDPTLGKVRVPYGGVVGEA